MYSGTWQIVWGPACFRPPLGWFDDQVIYVMRDPTFKPVRFVIVIRGTNPISLSDWIFGDLLAHPPTAWPFNRTAHLTPSTAIGLSILLSLGAEPSVALRRIECLVDTAALEKVDAAASESRFRKAIDIDVPPAGNVIIAGNNWNPGKSDPEK